MLPLAVTAALIRRGDRILIAQRKPGSHLGLLWEFPGGKIQFGETPEECLAREIEEELALPIRVGSLFSVESHVYGERHILLIVYNCTPLTDAEPELRDVHDFAWVQVGEMGGYRFAPADWGIVRKLGGVVAS